MSRKPQKTRCQEWFGYWTMQQCGRPLTHRMVARWRGYPAGQPDRVLMCEKHARTFVACFSPFSSVVISVYRVRRPQ